MNHKNSQTKHGTILVFGILALVAAVIFLYTPVIAQAQGASTLRMLQSDTSRIVLEFEVTDFSTQIRSVEGKNFSVVSVSGLDPAGDPGSPNLPSKGTMIGIPPGAQISLSVLVDDRQSQILGAPVLPSPKDKTEFDPQTLKDRLIGLTYTPDSKVYASNQNYPADVARIRSVGNWRSQRYAVIEFHPFQYNPATRQLIFHKRVRVQITLTYPRGANAATLGGVVNEGAFDQVFRKNLINYDTAKNWRTPLASTMRQVSASVSPYSVGSWYKIGVNADGIYQVMCSQIPATIADASKIQIYKEEQTKELAIFVAGGNDWSTCDSSKYLEFFGQAPVSKYSTVNYYWLTYDQASGKRMTTQTGSGVTPVNSFTNTVHREQHIVYSPETPWAEGADHWYWLQLASIHPSVLSKAVTFTTPFLTPGGSSAEIQVKMSGYGLVQHSVALAINGNPLSAFAPWNDFDAYTATATFPQSYLNNGLNTLVITDTSIVPVGQYDVIDISGFDVSYQQAFTVTTGTNTLRFRQVDPGSWQYQINGFTNANVELFDITNPYTVTRVATSTIAAGALFSLQFGNDDALSHEYLALTSDQRKSPVSISLDTASTLHAASNRADYIFIAPSGFKTQQLTELANYRGLQGLITKTVDVQDIYDEFSDGAAEPDAIRNFLQYANTGTNWQSPKPQYALLVGDGHLDPKEYCRAPSPCIPSSWITPPGKNFIPAYMRMVEPGIGRMGETSSDNRYVSFMDNDPVSPTTIPQMFIGRLPANSAADVDAMVAKILANETPVPGNWRSTVSFVTDNGYFSNGGADPGGDFGMYSELVAGNSQYMPNSLINKRIYYNPCTDTVSYPYCFLPFTTYSDSTLAHNQITSTINSGSLIVNYVGHGSDGVWADESLLTIADLSLLTNSNRYPVFLEMTCLTGKFDYLISSSIAELNVRASGKGALATWASSGKGYAQGHDYLNRGFFDSLVQQGKRTLGQLTADGNAYLLTNSGGWHLDLIDTYLLFGDPASRVQIQFLNYYYLPFISK
jgi:hypothetical protein